MNPGACLCHVPDVDDLFDVLLGDHFQADDAAIESSVELEIILLRALHVHNVDRVVVKLHMSLSLVLSVRVLVHGADKSVK